VKFQRKLVESIKWGAIGTAIPAIILGILSGVPLREITPMDRENDIAWLPFMVLSPTIGYGFVFALAAFASAFDSPRIAAGLITSGVLVAINRRGKPSEESSR
jgi:hypothetical protein